MAKDITAVEMLLRALDPAKATRLYNGRSGCACGCQGTYTDADPSKARRKVKHMLGLLPNLDDFDSAWFSTPFQGEAHIAVERNGRVNVIYFRAE